MATAKPGLRNIRVIDLTQGTSGPYCCGAILHILWAFKITKELAQRRLNGGLEDGMRVYAALGRLLRTTEGSSEGPRASAEKRQSKFKGG